MYLSKDWLQHAERTRLFDRWQEWEERYCAGAVVSGARVVGNRVHDAVIRDRERRAAAMSASKVVRFRQVVNE